MALTDFFTNLFSTDGFPPRWSCGPGWTQAVGWLHILSDWAIFGAYSAIPVVLALFLRRRRDIPFPSTGWLFVGFILSCGITHLADSTMFYHPAYRALGLMKLCTAVVSWATVVSLVRIMPSVLRVPGIQRQNADLRTGIQDKEREARSFERVRDQLENKNAGLTRQLLHLQSAFEATGVFAAQWEPGSDSLVWQMGTEKQFAELGIPVLTDWTQLLGVVGARTLQEATHGLRVGGPVVDLTLPIHGDRVGRTVRIVSSLSSSGTNGPTMVTCMARMVSAPIGSATPVL